MLALFIHAQNIDECKNVSIIRVEIIPNSVTLVVGEKQEFTIMGYDTYGHSTFCLLPAWEYDPAKLQKVTSSNLPRQIAVFEGVGIGSTKLIATVTTLRRSFKVNATVNIISKEIQALQTDKKQPTRTSTNYLFYIVIALIILIAFFIYFRRRRQKIKFQLPSLLKGSAIMVEGPIESKKNEICYNLLKKELEDGKKVAIITFSPDEPKNWFMRNVGKSAMDNLKIIEATDDLTELGVMISEALSNGAQTIFLPILSVLLLRADFRNVADFVSFNINKLKKKKVSSIFTLEPESTTRINISSLELLVDFVAETKVEGATHYIKIKKSIEEEISIEWKKYA